jgi:hypothetical protein
MGLITLITLIFYLDFVVGAGFEARLPAGAWF